MLNLDDKKLKCALILGILFFVLSHPYLYRLAHRNLSQVVSFLDADGCPTELGVLVMALVFVGVVYWGHDELASMKPANNKKANNGGNNVILNKCRTYCHQVSDELNQENAMMNNIANTNNNQMANNVQLNMNNQVANNGNVPMNNGNVPMNNVRLNVPAMSNQIPNNVAVNNNNIQMNQNRMNNAMMNNQLQNNVPVQAPMPSVNLNNASNLGMDNLNNVNTGSSDMGLLNAQSCSDNPQCSGNMNAMVGGQAYDPNLSNMNNGNMFSENTTYHDDMYASLF
jgi:hypothetical protein